MLRDYDTRAKSPHWQRQYANDFVDRLLDPAILSRFRSGDRSALSSGMDERRSWFRTAGYYERMNATYGTKWQAYAECRVGSPSTRRIAGRRFSSYDITRCQNFMAIAASVERAPGLIVEIGGGFGGVTHKLKKKWPGAAYISLDLPEALTLQGYYLSQLHPGARFYFYDDHLAGRSLSNFDYALLPGWLATAVPDDTADLVINMRSMMEMTPDVIAGYFHQIHRFTRPGGVFYNLNRYEKRTVGQPIRIAEYPYDERWQVVSSKPAMFAPNAHELVTRRLEPGTSGDIQNVLAGIRRSDVRHRHRIPLTRRLRLLRLLLPSQAHS